MEGVGLFPIEEVVSSPFGGTLEKHIELDGFPQDVEKVDFVWGGMVKKPKNFHRGIMPQRRRSCYTFPEGKDAFMNLSWEEFFGEEGRRRQWKALLLSLEEMRQSKTIYPPKGEELRAFELCKAEDVKVVILGQDPYHEKGQAMGLSFSVPKGVKLPPSLRNIYKELESDLGIRRDPQNGDLTGLAVQGVLFLNVNLTVEEGKPLSHSFPFYAQFTRDVLSYLDQSEEPIAFVFWGGFAQKFASCIHNKKHRIIASAHPSPLSANRGGFFGSKPFSEVNRFLIESGRTPIDWSR